MLWERPRLPLDAILFVLIGLQLPRDRRGPRRLLRRDARSAGAAACRSLVILTRLAVAALTIVYPLIRAHRPPAAPRRPAHDLADADR